ncbi:peroxisomal carnitine O-octanoyltransferase-like [Physella acuta]|uniref:peroxisomal carnitine O-octanoyltransferase-like n=1 Tax=Physella acuta TaxID=109671 RepID=UPI0027DD5F2E|nr:peroxisomal carnitine O-octanoyltransferase-like [Physella acuta]
MEVSPLQSTMFPPRHNQRKFSTRLLDGVPFDVGDIQSFLRKSLADEQQRAREDSELTTKDIFLPRLSIANQSTTFFGKRVIFNIDEKEIKEKEENKKRLLKQTSATKFLTKEAVKYCLDNSDPLVLLSFNSLLSDLPSGSEMGRDGVESGELSIVFEGNLKHVSRSEKSRHELPAERRLQYPVNSRMANVAMSSSFIIEQLWPWPWLEPDVRAHALYKTSKETPCTFAEQSRLPMLRVPDLKYSLSRFLQASQPCVKTAEYKHLKQIADSFAAKEGKECQKALVNKAETLKNWISAVLPNYTGCYNRQGAPYFNTAIIAPFLHDLWPERNDSQIDRAAYIISLATEFWMLLRNEDLEPISDGNGHTMCMHKFRKLFSSVKIPGQPCDKAYHFFKTSSEDEETPRHIIVIYNGHIFKLEVVDVNYKPMRTNIIKKYLRELKRCVDEGVIKDSFGLGVLTSMNRDEWCAARAHLMNISTVNEACLYEIEEAMFVISLEDLHAVNSDLLPHESVFGDGCNRWYDKSLSFYVYGNGIVTVNVNNSLVDGPVVAILLHYIHLRILEDTEKWDDDVVVAMSRSALASAIPSASAVFDNLGIQLSVRMNEIQEAWDSKTKHRYSPAEMDDEQTIYLLEFYIDDIIEKSINKASVSFANLSASVETATCKFDEYDRDIFQIKNINTDAFAHLLIHLTFFKMYHKSASVGSRVSLKRFYHGGHEILRSTNPDVVQFCQIMMDKKANFIDQRLSFWRAEKKHRDLLRECCSGMGFGSHLAGLKVMAADLYPTQPELFSKDKLVEGVEVYDIYCECVAVGSTGCAVVLPQSTVGYGVGYTIANTKIIFNVSSWKEVRSTSSQLFVQSLHGTLKDMNVFVNRL